MIITMIDLLNLDNFATQYFLIFSGISLLRYVNYVDNAVTSLAGSIMVTSLTWSITKYTRSLIARPYLSTEKKAVLITGADKGVTNEVALKLNEQGFRVYATFMDIKGSGVKNVIDNSRFEDRMVVKHMDITSEKDVERVANEVTKELEANGEQLWAVINGAEVRELGHADWAEFALFAKIFNVNTLGNVRVVRAFLPLLRLSKGRIINVESIAGRLILPSLTAYCMTKSANLAFSDALRRQLKGRGVSVSTIELAYDREFTTQDSSQWLTKKLMKTWGKTPSIVKLMYGDEYIEELIISRLGKLAGWFRNDHDQVMECFVEAVRAQEPDIRYLPYSSYFAKIVATIVQIVPGEWLDYYYASSENNKLANS